MHTCGVGRCWTCYGCLGLTQIAQFLTGCLVTSILYETFRCGKRSFDSDRGKVVCQKVSALCRGCCDFNQAPLPPPPFSSRSPPFLPLRICQLSGTTLRSVTVDVSLKLQHQENTPSQIYPSLPHSPNLETWKVPHYCAKLACQGHALHRLVNQCPSLSKSC